MSTVEVSCHLIVSANFRGAGDSAWVSGKPGVRVSKSKPSLSPKEVAIKLNLSLPIALFQRPELAANITVPSERAPFVITPDIQENIAQAIRTETGFEVRLAVVNREGGGE